MPHWRLTTRGLWPKTVINQILNSSDRAQMSRTPARLRLSILCGAALLPTIPFGATPAGDPQTTDWARPAQQSGPQIPQTGGDTASAAVPRVPRWLDEVRSQRRALQEQRRAQRDARRRAIDPVGAAQFGAREDAFLRRRQERQDMIEQDRRSFLNQGPWSTPWPPPRPAVPSGEQGEVPTTPDAESLDWDNGWYFRGW